MAGSLHHAGDGLAECRSRPGSSVLVAVSSIEKSLLLPTGTWHVRISHDRDRSYRSEVDGVADGGSPCRGVFRFYVWVEVLNCEREEREVFPLGRIGNPANERDSDSLSRKPTFCPGGRRFSLSRFGGFRRCRLSIQTPASLENSPGLAVSQSKSSWAASA